MCYLTKIAAVALTLTVLGGCARDYNWQENADSPHEFDRSKVGDASSRAHAGVMAAKVRTPRVPP